MSRLLLSVLALSLVADALPPPGLGVALASDGPEVPLFVASVGRDGAPVSLVRSAPDTGGSETRIRLADGIVEWWRTLASGLEHGVTIDARPPGEGPLRVEVEATGLSPRLRSDDEVELLADGAVVMTYSHLVTLDASGARVPGRMEVEDGRIVLAIDDAGARYPLVVDPLLIAEEAALRAPTALAAEALGERVAITADGTRIVTSGNPCRVFRRSGTTWTLEASLLQGTGVAISADGTRAIVARPGSLGRATVHVRSGTAWTMEADLGDMNGRSAAMDADGTRAIIGRGGSGARIYARAGTGWSMEYDVAGPRTVRDVAITRDGSRAFLGQPLESSSQGWVRELVRSGTTWTVGQTIAGSNNQQHFGESVAVSADGLRLAVGAPESPSSTPGPGHAEVYVRGTTWTREALLVPTGGATSDMAGASVGISGDGRLIVVGAPDVGSSRGRVVLFVRSGTAWSEATTGTPAGLADFDLFGGSMAMADAERFVVGSPGDDVGTTNSAGTAYVFRIGESAGTSCGADTLCASGFCTDGVCCDMRCDSACESCSAAGACLPDAAGTSCRASAGVCDPMAESCTGTSRTCPVDVRSASGTVCRAPAGTCDVAETCDGSSAACGPDVRVAAATECRAAAGLCDRAELCDGTSAACPASGASGVLASGASCRAATGVCDLPEVCDGSSQACPGDVLLGAGTACGSSAGTCATGGMCNGTTGACIGGSPLAAGTVCLYASPANPCDVDDVCNGTSTTCTPRFAAAGTVCNDSLAGRCDDEDVCTGTSADCVPTFLSGTECRPAVAPCDSAEVCAGSSPVCPPDGVEAAGMSCRAASDPSCDPVEVCDGLASACPADVNACVDAGPADAGPADAGPADAGARDAGPADSGAAVDAGPPPVATTGCGCRASASAPAVAPLLALGLLLVRRRRTR